ncbi:hypothetical protein [Pseudoalteromonas umbrosa]|uniref:hypothetical protein n=1 Tax=Pseudoalteromonas umbrosa TaxID=3048489 RepID=UPI0024C2DF40|nr:hypothetical protein [Pseudoalteromonas sp. B95]MDK1290132.1 hypothetical protein [Pseudoalteromonas sp. B95]
MGLLDRARKSAEKPDDWVSTLMLVDYSSLLYKGLSVNAQMMCKGLYTGGLLGLTDQLGTLVREHKPEHMIVCADGSPYYRKTQVFEQYKEDRKRRKQQFPDEAYAHTRQLGDQFLKTAGIAVWREAGWEADDLFALAVKALHTDYDRILIASADDDLYQLFSYDNVYLCKKNGLYGLRHFQAEYPDLTPEDWVIFNAIKGGHNNYKGIKGIGSVKALEIMRDDALLEATYQQHKELIDVGLQVCSLPLPLSSLEAVTNYPITPKPCAPQYDELAVRTFLRQHGIRPKPTLGQALTHLSGF